MSKVYMYIHVVRESLKVDLKSLLYVLETIVKVPIIDGHLIKNLNQPTFLAVQLAVLHAVVL